MEGRACESARWRTGLWRCIMPSKIVQFTLIRPVIRSFNQFRSQGVVTNVFPFLGIALPFPQLAVEKIFLPDWFFYRTRPVPCNCGSPSKHPITKRSFRNSCWGTEQVQMVGHQYVSAHKPRIGFLPRVHNELVDILVGQQRSSPFGADCYEYDDGLIGPGYCRVVRKRAS